MTGLRQRKRADARKLFILRLVEQHLSFATYAAANLAGEHAQQQWKADLETQQWKADLDTRDDLWSEPVLVIAVAYTAGRSDHLLGWNALDLRRVYPCKNPAAVGDDVGPTN